MFVRLMLVTVRYTTEGDSIMSAVTEWRKVIEIFCNCNFT